MMLDTDYLRGMSELDQQHITLVHRVNMATTDHEHRLLCAELNGFRAGARAAGVTPDLIACDLYYINHGHPDSRPMCCGVWLDWTAKETT